MFLSQLAQDERPIDDYLSKKFSLLSFAAIFFVVFAHSCNWDFFCVSGQIGRSLFPC